MDRSKGLRSAARQAFGKCAVVQRCQWHKRENVVAYLSKAQQPIWRRRLQQAYERPTYQEAKVQLMQLHQELSVLNQSAAASLNEVLEETLSLHELGVFPLQNHQLPGVVERVDRRALWPYRPLEKLKPETPLAGGRIAGY